MDLPIIKISDYWYDLPEDRIALHPLAQRDASKLLFYNKGEITHEKFTQLSDLLTSNDLLFFNDTKVIPARFNFEKETGGTIEVFLLQPVYPSSLVPSALACTKRTMWKCTIGNVKRWTMGKALQKQIGDVTVNVTLIDRKNGYVEFTWSPPTLSFAEILHMAGAVPLPPYIKRSVEKSDEERYQTVYSHFEGAVAAPTAGLHFTDRVLADLKAKSVVTDFLTLHVSAGTFQPVKTENAVDHTMHEEQIIIRKRNLVNLLKADKQVIAVGTTAMRTLESLYWYGALLLKDPQAEFQIDKLLPYQFKNPPRPQAAFQAVLKSMEEQRVEEILGRTSIYILPGYPFRVCKGLITNFHQPGSTLMLLVAATIGKDWKQVYEAALANDYRFLSYGDSSFLKW